MLYVLSNLHLFTFAEFFVGPKFDMGEDSKFDKVEQFNIHKGEHSKFIRKNTPSL